MTGPVRSRRVAPVESVTALRRLWELDARTFADSGPYFPFSLYVRFWATEPEMFWSLHVDGSFAGGAALAPFSRSWVRAYAGGEASELDARPRDLAPGRPGTDWYFGSVALREPYRGVGHGPWAVRQIFLRHLEGGRFAFPLRIYASAYSEAGGRLLRRVGATLLRPAPDTLDDLDAYQLRAADPAELRRLLLTLTPTHLGAGGGP